MEFNKDAEGSLEEAMLGPLTKLATALNRAVGSGKQVLFVERRTENRLWCSELVQVWCKEEDAWIRKGIAVLEDISPSGACIQIEAALPLDAAVRIRHADWKVEGVVRYCVHKEEGFFIGLRLDEGCKWNEQTFRPKHLLNPDKLTTRRKP
ncbi:MAG: PilZ domain-containing protein [Candidatus Solibacter usitatus]|nr:PilZ domain-containing protein [Candidatus Solibacter usitatus]